MFKSLLLVFVSGGAGSMARFAVQHYGAKSWGTTFPLPTFLVNIIGSLLIGFFFALFTKSLIGNDTRLLLMVGFCGGFTTFSAFSLESFHLLKSGATATFMTYVVLSIVVCLLCVWLGHWLGEMLTK